MNNVYEKVFESNNIVFVKINEKLINEYLDLVNTPSIQDLVNSKRKVISLEKELEWIKSKIENNDYVFSMLEKDTNMFIGNVELMDYDGKSAELAISITEGMQNKHYGQEAITTMINYAFNVLGLEQLNAVVFSHNERSLHCLEKYGFVKYKEVKNVKQLNEKEIDDVYLKLNR
jgi:RimJ/RimL family protein N-acetyltransferase